MSEQILISCVEEDNEFAVDLLRKLAVKGLSSKIVNANPFVKVSDILGIAIVLSKNYIANEWIELIQEQEMREISSKTNLVVISIGRNIKIPTIFEQFFSIFINDSNNYDKEISSVDLYLKGIIKYRPNAPLDLARNLM